MAKKKRKTDVDIFAELAGDTGCVVLDDEKPVKYYLDTGNLATNYICSGKFIPGGIAGGRITEIFGPESSSKSLFGTNVLFGCQKLKGYAIILDCENTMNADFAKNASHLDTKKVLIAKPRSLEHAFKKIHVVIEKIREVDKKNPIVVVYDSITVSPCERELREVQLPENYTDAEFKKVVGGKEQPGERAKICSREFRKLTPLLEKNDATLLVINQTRDKIGVMFGDNQTTGGGGRALPFYATCRLATRASKQIVKKVDKAAKLEIPIGVNISLSNKKNKAYKPFLKTTGLNLFFDKGINPLTGLLSILVIAERIKPTGSGNFEIVPEYAGDGATKFKSSLERNDVPLQVLLDNPAVIDAKTKEEVEEYMSAFSPAIEQSSADDVVENEVKGAVSMDEIEFDFEE